MLKFFPWLLIMIALALGACSTPEPLGDETAENLTKVASGPASGRSETSQVQPAVAASYMGDANAENTTVEGATMQRTNTASGHLQTGFTFAATMQGLQQALEQAAAVSPTMRALQMQLDRALAAEPVDDALVTTIIDKIRAEEGSLREALARAGGDLSSLTNLTQIFTMVSANGSDHPMTDAQAEAIAGTIAPTVQAAKGSPVTAPPAPPITPPAEGDGN